MQKAIAYIFCDTPICDDAASAMAVTFAQDVATRSVTLQDDVYDQSSTLSSGAALNSSNVQVQVQELLEHLHAARTHLGGLFAGGGKEQGREGDVACVRAGNGNPDA